MRTVSSSASVPELVEESGLGSSHEPIDPLAVGDLLDRHHHLDGTLERLATENDDTFRLRTGSGDYLVKVSAPSESAEAVAVQTAVMRYLQEAAPDLPVQRVRLTVDGADSVPVASKGNRTRVLRVLDFIEGEILAETEPDAAQLVKVGEMLGRIDATLQPFSHPAAERRLVWDLRHFHSLEGLLDHTANLTQRRLAREVFRMFDRHVVPQLDRLDTQVIHGDFSPYNVVVDPQRDEFVTGVLDFGDTMRSALIFDPAVSIANLLGEPEHPWDDAGAFLAGYLRTRPIAEPELPLLAVAAMARLALRALLSSWRADRVPGRRDYVLAHASNDWSNLARAQEVPLDDVVSQLRGSQSRSRTKNQTRIRR
jgi:hydroxylysine kinase